MLLSKTLFFFCILSHFYVGSMFLMRCLHLIRSCASSPTILSRTSRSWFQPPPLRSSSLIFPGTSVTLTSHFAFLADIPFPLWDKMIWLCCQCISILAVLMEFCKVHQRAPEVASLQSDRKTLTELRHSLLSTLAVDESVVPQDFVKWVCRRHVNFIIFII